MAGTYTNATLDETKWPVGFIYGHILGIRAGAKHCGQCPDKAEKVERERLAKIEKANP